MIGKRGMDSALGQNTVPAWDKSELENNLGYVGDCPAW